MKIKLLIPVLLYLASCPLFAQLKIEDYTVDTSVVASRLHVPWEILWGPDDNIWLTERNGKISRLNPVTKVRKVMFTFTNVFESGESGLLGLALHPRFPDSAFVYAVYTYQNSGIKERLVRLTYDKAQDRLGSERILIDNIRGNTTHDGSRLLFGPDGKLYMTTGEAQDKPASQNLGNYLGKILRINSNGTVPSDNPIANSHIWSYGHRNPQGLIFSPSGKLYNSEHGENENDEINIITKNKNYGWPYVRGFCDNDFRYDTDPSKTETYYCNLWNPVAPIKRWTPTLATAGLDYYNHTLFGNFANSLLLVTLKEADLRILKLSADGNTITQETVALNNAFGRLRDICISKSGEIYLATSNTDGRGTVRATDDRIIKFTPRPITTSLENEVKPDLKVLLYPNPAQNFVNIQGLTEEAVLEIKTVEGNTVFSNNVSNSEINISQLINGAYLYQIKTISGKVSSGKFVVSRP